MLTRNTMTCALLTCFLSTAAHAVITITENPGVTQFADGYSATSNGWLMNGAHVTVRFNSFSGGGSETVPWVGVDPAAGSGEAVGTGWTLRLAGESPTVPFELIKTAGGNAIDVIEIDAFAGGLVFDDVSPSGSLPSDPTEGTVGGQLFTPVTQFGNWAGNLDIHYINQAAITGQPPAGDIYGTMAIAFVQSPFDANDRLTFTLDMDSVIVPEPATLGLFSLGSLMLLPRRKRRVA